MIHENTVVRKERRVLISLTPLHYLMSLTVTPESSIFTII